MLRFYQSNDGGFEMIDIHRHDEYSLFDGFGKPAELAELAKELGHSALSILNHGTTSGLVKHYEACKKAEIDCIMGVEAYFQPKKYSEEERKTKERYHLGLIVKNNKGYENVNELMLEGEKNKYYNPIITFDMLEEHAEGLICTSACIQGFICKAIKDDNLKMAYKAARRFKEIFDDDFYIEIQPYIIDNEGTQERVNRELMKIADELDIKCILTSDSHYGRKEDWDTYLKMHEIANHNYDIEMTYGERWMPTEKEICLRAYKMHKSDIEDMGYDAKKYIKKMIANIEDIHSKVEQNILDNLELKLPKLSEEGEDSFDTLKRNVINGLKKRGYAGNKKYIKRLKEELKVIRMHDFSDYFLMVQEYVMWAKNNGIYVGPGRGSVCNCQVAWALGITDVDSLYLNLDFRRFLREDKNKLPDVDLDFETSRRQEVIDHLIEKYPGHAAQICSYGLYKVDNLVNDLAKVCGLDITDKDVDSSEIQMRKQEIAAIKKFINSNIDPESENFIYENVKDMNECKMYDKQYDGIIKHFSKLFKKMRFIGTHAAGVAITSDKLTSYCGLRLKDGKLYTSYDLADLDIVHVVKFDMLGLRTMESLGELRELTGVTGVTEEMLEDDNIYKMLRDGDTEGIFQFESSTAKSILSNIQCDCFEDVIAASSLNRPGPLSLSMPDKYAHNKFNLDDAKESPFYEYTKETYGTIVYQEQVQLMCVEIGNLTWAEADRVMKLMKNAIASMGELEKINRDKAELTEKFVAGAIENGYDEKVARDMFENILVYTFNKGHSAGYSLVTMEEAYQKLYNPTEFWYVKLKYTDPSKANEAKIAKFKEKAVSSGSVIMLPHVNYSSNYSLRKVEGERVIQEGLSSIKGVGAKAADYIEQERRKNGIYTSFDNFYDRVVHKGSPVNKGVIEKLKTEGALEFNKKVYISRVTKYNSSLYSRAM